MRIRRARLVDPLINPQIARKSQQINEPIIYKNVPAVADAHLLMTDTKRRTAKQMRADVVDVSMLKIV